MTYTQNPGEEIVFEKHDDARFYLFAFQYFFELPFRIPYASVIAYAGEKSIGDQTYDRIFISWNTAGTPPQWDVSENPETLRQIRGWLEEVGTAPGIALSGAHSTGGAD